MTKVKWSYGVISVTDRLNELLPRTLESLRTGGFTAPRLFIDGSRDTGSYYNYLDKYQVTYRGERLKTFGNWVLALWELYMREPHADRYALFEDDLVTYPHLREYLDSLEMQLNSYWNLYLHPWNHSRIIPDPESLEMGKSGFFMGKQSGYGGVALIFNRWGVEKLLSSRELSMRPQCTTEDWWRKHDGIISNAMKIAGFTELVHYPTLVFHTGTKSVLNGKAIQPPATTFLGEQYDARNLISCPTLPIQSQMSAPD